MGYNRRYSKRRSSSGLGFAVSDVAAIADRFGPKGTLITGGLGFVFFYYLMPWLLMAWANHNKAGMTGAHAGTFSQILDDIFIRRFVHPSEWAGIAILLICVALACWKAATRSDFDRSTRNDLTGLGKLLARFLD